MKFDDTGNYRRFNIEYTCKGDIGFNRTIEGHGLTPQEAQSNYIKNCKVAYGKYECTTRATGCDFEEFGHRDHFICQVGKFNAIGATKQLAMEEALKMCTNLSSLKLCMKRFKKCYKK